MMQIRCWCPGIPAPGGSKRAFVVRGRAVVTDDCRRNKDWRAVVSMAAAAAMAGRDPLTGPIAVSVVFQMPRPKGHFGARGLRPSAPAHHVTKPDATKLWRSTEDALKGIAWRDDAQVVDQHVRKVYGETPGAWITIEAADQRPVEARTMAPRQSGLFEAGRNPSVPRENVSNNSIEDRS